MAGSVIASRLSEDRHTSVLVLEAGGDGDPFVRIPRTWWTVSSTPELLWGYETEPQKKSVIRRVKELFYLLF